MKTTGPKTAEEFWRLPARDETNFQVFEHYTNEAERKIGYAYINGKKVGIGPNTMIVKIPTLYSLSRLPMPIGPDTIPGLIDPETGIVWTLGFDENGWYRYS